MTFEEHRDFLAAEARRHWGDARASALAEAIERLARHLAAIDASPLHGEEPFFFDIFNLPDGHAS
ncbi:MAG TPA: hypothetical protein VFB90_01140 [Dehalococcoidia bacterium]|nr:hypothetical protein [Dehalococcoidia bacterium]